MFFRLANFIRRTVRAIVRAIQHNARNAFANACHPAAVCVMQRCCPPPPRIIFGNILATGLFAAASLLAHNAFAQTQQCAPTDGACKCVDSGHSWIPLLSSCELGVVVFHDSKGGSTNLCRIDESSATDTPQCADIVGPNFDFPTQAGNYYYNCDPDGTRGLIPATINTIQATACQCVDSRKTSIVDQDGGFKCVLECESPLVANADKSECILPCESPKVGNADKTECVCPSDYRPLGDACVPNAENFGDDVSQEYLCEAFGGNLQPANNGANQACSGMDRHDTFCIVDSTGAFPCRGLFKHLRECNLTYNRRAENMFFCGEKCASDKTAVGAKCIQ